MLRSLAFAVALAAGVPATAYAQAAPPAVAAPEPARLAAAQALIAKLMPPDRLDAMMDQMLRPMFGNMRETMLNGPQFASLRAENPQIGATLDEFLDGEMEHSLVTVKAAMPALVSAMARAYARRFTLEHLQAISAFFDTPAGRAYAEQAPTLMSDPDILAAQRAMMTDAMTGMMERVEKFAAKAAAETK